MALLTDKQRKKRLDFLGLTDDEKGIRALQKKYMRSSDVDGKYGPATDKVLRHVYNVKKYAPSFKPEEFRCTCGHCTGYPSFMKKVELQHLQTIRNHYKRPMIVTSGLRCRYANNVPGSIQNSLHLSGYATDFYMKGVTDTLANRKKAIKYIKKLPNHHYTYGNGINSNGYAVAAPYMGNALHTDTSAPAKVKETIQDKMCSWAKSIAKSGKYKYIRYTEPYGHECAVCHPHNGKNRGWNCIGYAFGAWHHAGLKSKCSCDVVDNGSWEKMLNSSGEYALGIARNRVGLTALKVIKSKKGVPISKLQKGDIVAYFKGGKYIHTALYIGGGKIADCTSGRKPNIKYGAKSYTSMTIKVVLRYVGK